MLAGGVMSVQFKLPAQNNSLGSAAALRCDHCRGELGPDIERYRHMQFCSSACMTAYQQRLAPETIIKNLPTRCFAFGRPRRNKFLSTSRLLAGAVGVLTFTQYPTSRRTKTDRGRRRLRVIENAGLAVHDRPRNSD